MHNGAQNMMFNRKEFFIFVPVFLFLFVIELILQRNYPLVATEIYLLYGLVYPVIYYLVNRKFMSFKLGLIITIALVFLIKFFTAIVYLFGSLANARDDFSEAIAIHLWLSFISMIFALVSYMLGYFFCFKERK
jgi:hypothetical protein